MLTVTIPVHPLSRAIILAEHGYEPVLLENHDFLFEIINTRITPDDLRAKAGLTTFIELTVNDRLAAHLAQYGLIAGLRLFKFHKHIMCRYADAQTRAKGKGHARPALQEFLNLYGVEEDAYGLDTAYKLYQRFCWEIQKKNPKFLEQMRRKPGVFLFKKKQVEPTAADFPVELAVSTFMAGIQVLVKRYHRKLEKQVRTYIYVEQSGLTIRQTADILAMPVGTVHYCCAAVRRRCRRNPAFARILQESLALPEPA